ncbi:Imidazoleglycerol-phosphate dehydratase [Pseudovibrio axinellae]|uniref:Imidazoleglycerol-phosphate dehydratase n=1 Tax=Pseudovibrio axinellae TaxID=989403 RepID=A0A165ZA33_9HYPH|nr:imidazoleglycerol-phosphate dehydratase HisB [Pseudovibrio axinellae]KZL19643.1 Imidazoleglycerol-phosphate dehydratase [Pseudovibrio axinellae]SEQ35298.1 imidazoleglycerol-phosphate dehydratase [Pseudovibrio axinellae]
MRQANIARGTKETTISVSVNLDGTGKYDIKTGVGFFDHMLEQLSRHSLVDMTIRADGDNHIDDHHTTEDVGIALGQAFKEALGDMSGITRYADTHLAMDEALTRVALDVSGRPFLVWQVDFPRDKIGTFDTELFEEFFRAFAMNAGFTLHIANVYGTNCHHIAETCFKAVARTMRTAIEPDPRQSGRVPTTKGQLGG